MDSTVFLDSCGLVITMYTEKFGAMPPEAHKTIVNLGGNSHMYLAMQKAVQQNKPINWGDYVQGLLKY